MKKICSRVTDHDIYAGCAEHCPICGAGIITRTDDPADQARYQRICPWCGNHHRQGDVYCYLCGRKLE